MGLLKKQALLSRPCLGRGQTGSDSVKGRMTWLELSYPFLPFCSFCGSPEIPQNPILLKSVPLPVSQENLSLCLETNSQVWAGSRCCNQLLWCTWHRERDCPICFINNPSVNYPKYMTQHSFYWSPPALFMALWVSSKEVLPYSLLAILWEIIIK